MRLNLANVITVLRLPLLGVIVFLLYQATTGLRFVAAMLIALLILMDSLDGIVARRRHEESLLGGALDIAVDRAVEFVLWVVFAHLRLIPVVIPLVIIVRGVFTDSIRSVAGRHGVSAHGMMNTALGKWLVGSPPMRTGYAVVKVVAFVALALALALRTGGLASQEPVYRLGLGAAWLATTVCLLRGLPVLLEAPGFMRTVAGEP